MGVVTADDGIELWVEVTGRDDGVPLVLCHGGPGMWDNLGPLAALLDHDRQVIRWDQRGCGRSGGADGPFSIAQSLADLDAGAPWPVNLACNAAINAETKTWNVDAIRAPCESLDVPSLFVHGEHDPRPPHAQA